MHALSVHKCAYIHIYAGTEAEEMGTLGLEGQERAMQL